VTFVQHHDAKPFGIRREVPPDWHGEVVRRRMVQ